MDVVLEENGTLSQRAITKQRREGIKLKRAGDGSANQYLVANDTNDSTRLMIEDGLKDYYGSGTQVETTRQEPITFGE